MIRDNPGVLWNGVVELSGLTKGALGPAMTRLQASGLVTKKVGSKPATYVAHDETDERLDVYEALLGRERSGKVERRRRASTGEIDRYWEARKCPLAELWTGVGEPCRLQENHGSVR